MAARQALKKSCVVKWSEYQALICPPFLLEKTKNLLFNGAKAVMGKIWTGEEGSAEHHLPDQAETPSGHALLEGQTLIGQDGRLMRGSRARGQSQITSNHTVVCVQTG